VSGKNEAKVEREMRIQQGINIGEEREGQI